MIRVILLLSFLSFVHARDCPVDPGHCDCYPSEGGHNLWCPDSRTRKIRIFFQSGFAWIVCNSDIPMNSADLMYELRELDFKGASAEFLRFKHCVIPEFSYADVVKAMNISSVKHLILEFGLLIDREFIPRQFHGLGPRLKRLSIRTTNNHMASDVPDIFVRGMFEGLDGLESLELTNNKVQSVTRHLLRPLFNLKYFAVREPKLTAIPDTLFRNQTDLRRIVISGDALTSIPRGLFDNNTGIEEIELLKTNSFSEFPEDLLSRLVNLRGLNVSGNALLHVVPGQFEPNVKLEQIQWTHFYCGDTRCNATVKGFAKGLSSLKKFKIRWNSKTELRLDGDFFEGCKNLEKVEMVKTGLKDVPDGLFRDTTRLMHLDLSRNELKIFPKLRNPRRLKTLVLSRNEINEIKDEDFKNYVVLTSLDLSSNRIADIDRDSFFGLSKLETLDLSHNSIAFNDANEPHWTSLTKLKKMDLSDNEIKIGRIHDDIAINALNLENLNLAQNSIGPYISSANFNFMQNRITVDLRYNAIEKIVYSKLSDNFVTQESSRAKVYLEGNPFACDCQTLPFFLESTSSSANESRIDALDLRKWKCSSPEPLKGRPFTGLAEEELTCLFPSDVIRDRFCPCKACLYSPAARAIDVDCSYSGLTKFPARMPENFGSDDVIRINMTGNSLGKLGRLPEEYGKVTTLYLSDNAITDFRFPPENLEILHLDGNNLTKIEDAVLEVFKGGLNELKLAQNPFTCDCDSRNLYFFAKNHPELIRDLKKVSFSGCPELLKILDIRSENEFCVDFHERVVLYALPVVMSLLVLLAALVVALWYKDRIIVILYQYPAFRHYFIWDNEKLMPYDVFIGYSHEDQDYVEKELLAGLETPSDDPSFNYKCLLAVRDFVPGNSIAEQIVRSVESSSRTIIVLSKAFIKSDWAQYEFDVAHEQRKVILLKYGDLPSEEEIGSVLKTYISKHTYIEHDHANFWRNLRYALPYRGPNKNWPRWLRYKKSNDKVQLIGGSSKVLAVKDGKTATDNQEVLKKKQKKTCNVNKRL